MSGLRFARTVFRKELKDGLRDRRSLLSALLYPLLGPLMIVFMFGAIMDAEREAREELVVPVAGAEHAPDLVSFLEEQGAIIDEAPADPDQAVREHSVEFVLVIDEDFQREFSKARPASVRLVKDGSRNAARPKTSRVERLVRRWGAEVSTLRLVARGVGPQVAQPIAFHEVDVASEQQEAASFMAFIPMFVLMAAFIGGMQVAMDATAGERERKSLEPLLLNPIPRSAIVLGKWAAACCFSGVSVLLILMTCAAVIEYGPMRDLGVNLEFGAYQAIGIGLAVLPTAFFAVGAQMLVASFARSYKEAQTYVSLLIFVPMLPATIATVAPIDPEPWMWPVPALGQQLLLQAALGGEPIAAWTFFAAGFSALACGVACVALTARLLRSEKIVFGR